MDTTVVRVHDLPWEGLGEDVTDCSTVEQIRAKAGLDWRVELVPVYADVRAIGPNPGFIGHQLRPISHRHAIVRSDTLGPLGVSGNYFQAIQNDEADYIVDGMMQAGLLTPTRAGFTHGGRRTFIVGAYNGPLEIGGVDPVDTFFALWNRHDGRGSLTAAILHVRRWCANQLPGIVDAIAAGTIAKRRSKNRQRLFNWNVRHTTKAADRIAEVQTAIERAGEANDAFMAQAQQMILRPFTLDDMAAVAKKLYPVGDKVKPATSRKNAEKVDALVALYRTSDNLNDVRNTAWGGWNAVAEYADHLTPFRATKVSTRAENRFLSITDPDGTAHGLKIKAYGAVAQVVGVGGLN